MLNFVLNYKLKSKLMRLFISIIVLYFYQPSYAQKIIDLTHNFSNKTLHWPTAKPFQLEKGFSGETPQGYYYAVNDFSTSEHVGTHMDAPAHFFKGSASISEIPLNKLIGSGIHLNMESKTLSNPDYQISIKDIIQWEKKFGYIPFDSIVLLDTGFYHFWGDAQKYLGTRKKGLDGVKNLHFPSFAPDTINWLIKNRKIKAIGIDTASIDYGQSKIFENHQFLGKNNVPFFENIGDMSQLPAKGFTVYALPMKIEGGTGAPLRIIAIVPQKA